MWDARRKINKIISLGYESEELIATVKKKGGTSTVSAVIYVVAFIAFVAFYISVILSSMNALVSIK